MTDCEQTTAARAETFLTAIPTDHDGQIDSIVIPHPTDDDDDELDIDVKSSADSGDTPLANHEIEEILNKTEPVEETSLLLPTQHPDALPDKMFD